MQLETISAVAVTRDRNGHFFKAYTDDRKCCFFDIKGKFEISIFHIWYYPQSNELRRRGRLEIICFCTEQYTLTGAELKEKIRKDDTSFKNPSCNNIVCRACDNIIIVNGGYINDSKGNLFSERSRKSARLR